MTKKPAFSDAGCFMIALLIAFFAVMIYVMGISKNWWTKTPKPKQGQNSVSVRDHIAKLRNPPKEFTDRFDKLKSAGQDAGLLRRVKFDYDNGIIQLFMDEDPRTTEYGRAYMLHVQSFASESKPNGLMQVWIMNHFTEKRLCRYSNILGKWKD